MGVGRGGVGRGGMRAGRGGGTSVSGRSGREGGRMGTGDGEGRSLSTRWSVVEVESVRHVTLVAVELCRLERPRR